MTVLTGLAALEAQIQLDLQYLNMPVNNWVLPKNSTNNVQHINVAIIGGGMSGIAAAFALKLKGIQAMVFEQAADGQEGPWIQPALMQTLRSPKHVEGPAMASPSLTFQAWFLAQWGQEAWAALDKIPRLQWGEYLQWYKKITEPHLFNEHCLLDLEVASSGSLLTLQTPTGIVQYQADYVVLAMGMESFSEANIPDFVQGIPKAHWEHSYAGSDYSRFKGLDVAVVGYSAGAMDSSATALENGAKSVEILIRSADMPRVNRGKVAGSPGFTSAYQAFSDAQKWHYSDYVAKAKTPAPHGSTLRVSEHENAYFNFDSPVHGVRLEQGKLHIASGAATFVVDHLILATGYRISWNKNDAFKRIAPHIKTWQEAYQAPASEENAGLASHPYLGTCFQLQNKKNDTLLGLDRLYCFNLSASVSMGPVIGLIPGTNKGAQMLADDICARLYLEHFDEHMNLVKTSTENELLGDEWTVAVPYQLRVNSAKALG